MHNNNEGLMGLPNVHVSNVEMKYIVSFNM